MIIQSLGNPYAKQGTTVNPLPVASGGNIVAPLPAPKKVASTQPIVSQPIVQPVKKDIASSVTSFIKTAPKKVAQIVKGVDFKQIGEALVSGAKALPGMTKQAGGVILSGLVKQKEATDAFFKPVKKIVGITQTGFDIDTKVKTKVKEVASSLREKGFQEQKKVTDTYAQTKKPSTGFQSLIESVAFNLPQVVASTGLSLATAIVTKNPALAAAVGLSTSYGLGSGEVYSSAREQGLSDARALPLSMAGGVIIGALDFVPLERLLKKAGAVETIKKSIIKNIASQIVSMGKQAGWEGITEGAQQIVGNAIAVTYNKNQKILEGVTESALVGAILGGGTDVSLTGIKKIIGITGRSSTLEKKVQQAISTPAESRTLEQKEIADAVLVKEMTPDEAASYVIENDIGKSDMGKAIMLTATQAKQAEKNVVIRPADDGKSMEVSVAEPLGEKENVYKAGDVAKQRIEALKEKKEKVIDLTVKPSEKRTVGRVANVDAGLHEIISKAKTPEESITLLDSYVSDFLKKADQSNVADLRAGLVKEITDLVGGTGNYKKDYAMRVAMRNDEMVGGLIRSLEGHIADIDDTIAKYPKREVSVAESIPGTKQKKSEKVPARPSKEEPVGTGKQKNSRLFERVKDTLGEEYTTKEIKYNELSLEKQAQSVVDLISEDPKKAVRVARGYEEPSPGMTQNAVAVALAETARAKGDWITAADLWIKTSLRSTRLGQEIVSLRGDFSVNEPLNAVKKLLNSRMEQVGRRYNDIIKGLALKEDSPMVKKVDALVKHEAKKLDKALAKAQKNIQTAQEIINALKCK